jgi:uncharacterized cupredoxin-like copper-binding protein
MKLLVFSLVGALVVGAAALPDSGGSETRTIVVRIEHSQFQPSDLSFKRGEAVRFVIRNDDPIDHEFILGDQEVQERHEDGREQEHGAIPGEISIDAGKEASTTYVFERRGSFIYGCHLPGHYDYGMKGTVQVR